TLVAQRLDLANDTLTGEPVTLAEGVTTDDVNRSAVSVTATGLVAYRTPRSGLRQLTCRLARTSAKGGDP
ncbi:MAG TPA: hypothetical protein VFB99_16825, partial [Vicinamibacterales bacterium]|nr:hypothetical protein [Vicinamibacterales bacterium]